jgi:DNA-binding NtrC family response regulator
MASKRKTIMLVDDDPISLETLTLAAESWGYDVCTAENGEEALALYELRLPDLVLSDMVMPKLDGLGLLRRLRGAYPNAKVILYSAYARISDAVAAIKSGAEDLITKPFDFNRLKPILEKLLEGESISNSNTIPAHSGVRPPECDLTSRDKRPQSAFHSAGWFLSWRPAICSRFGLPRMLNPR